MKGYVNGQMVTLVKDQNTGKWVPNAVAVANNNRSVATTNRDASIVSDEKYQMGFMDAFEQLGAVLDGVADTGELQAALNQFKRMRERGEGPDRNITFQDLMDYINGCRQRRTNAGYLLQNPDRARIGYNN